MLTPTAPRLTPEASLALRILAAQTVAAGRTVPEAAAIHGVSESFVYKACHAYGVGLNRKYFRVQFTCVDGVPHRPCCDCTKRAGREVLKPVDQFQVNKNPKSRCGRVPYCFDCARERDRKRGREKRARAKARMGERGVLV